MTAPIVPAGEHLAPAVEVLKGGGLVISPTTTNYNILCDATNPDAVARVFKVKERVKVAPLPVSLPQPSMIPTYVEVPDGFDTSIFDAMLPGEVSFVFWQRYPFPDQLTCGLHTVAVSVTTHPVMRSMVVGLGGPIAATSANVSGQGNVFIPLARAIEEVGDRVDLIVDAGATAAELAPDHANRVNTIVDLTFDKPRLVRPGWVSLEEVRKYLPDVDDDLDAYKALLAERTGAAS